MQMASTRLTGMAPADSSGAGGLGAGGLRAGTGAVASGGERGGGESGCSEGGGGEGGGGEGAAGRRRAASRDEGASREGVKIADGKPGVREYGFTAYRYGMAMIGACSIATRTQAEARRLTSPRRWSTRSCERAHRAWRLRAAIIAAPPCSTFSISRFFESSSADGGPPSVRTRTKIEGCSFLPSRHIGPSSRAPTTSSTRCAPCYT